MLPASLTKRLVNHSRPQDVIEGGTADWTMNVNHIKKYTGAPGGIRTPDHQVRSLVL